MIKAMVLLHGRGADSKDIMGISHYFGDLKFIAPDAPGRAWYPYSFLMPVEKNEPSLTNSLQIVKNV